MLFIGLDLSLTGTGVAIKDDNSLTLSLIRTKPTDFKHEYERFAYIIEKIKASFNGQEKPNLICIESFFVPHTAERIGAAIPCIQLGTLVRNELIKDAHSILSVSPTRIKKWLCDKGNLPKDQITKELLKNKNIDAANNNTADAAVICLLGECVYAVKNGLNLEAYKKYEINIAKKILSDDLRYNF